MTKLDNRRRFDWQPNQAGDLECKVGGHRYRIEEGPHGTWLIRKPLELSVYSEALRRFKSVDECIEWVAQNATGSDDTVK